ncbi:MAG: hypothetical protein AABX01_01550 [Candidatus Micrarchaeota archaeon]
MPKKSKSIFPTGVFKVKMPRGPMFNSGVLKLRPVRMKSSPYLL